MTKPVAWVLLVGCAVIAALDASTACSILIRSLRADTTFAGAPPREGAAGVLASRKPEPLSTRDGSLPRRPFSAPASEPLPRLAARLEPAPLAPPSRAGASSEPALERGFEDRARAGPAR